MHRAIYLDHHATTPLAPEARAAMLPFLDEEYGNPSSTGHELGRRAARALEEAREVVASAVGARRGEVIFTSGATESDNLAILGAARALRGRGDHVVTCATEHRAVLDACAQLEREGFRVTVLPVESNGVLDLERLERAIDDHTVLVSLMHGNNEIGVLHDLAGAAERCHRRGALLHSDATQALGRLPLDLQALGVDLLSITAHKAYGPKGVGALVARGGFEALQLAPLFHGGGQEGRVRPGTQNTIGIAGFAAACALIPSRLAPDAARAQRQSREFLARLRAVAADLVVHGDLERRLPGNLNLRFPGLAARALMERLPELALSAGAACHSGSAHPSHVLAALGLDAEQARCAVRIGFGRTTTDDDVERAAASFERALRELRPRATRA
ncbi:MAG: cysteine desulfurase [Planctomycetes bacterium]|nr:cysteine desulfurase [Planctomycetota bacterium]